MKFLEACQRQGYFGDTWEGSPCLTGAKPVGTPIDRECPWCGNQFVIGDQGRLNAYVDRETQEGYLKGFHKNCEIEMGKWLGERRSSGPWDVPGCGPLANQRSNAGNLYKIRKRDFLGYLLRRFSKSLDNTILGRAAQVILWTGVFLNGGCDPSH